MDTILIGICGGSGSGKSTLAKSILAAFPDKSSILHMDNFYKEQPGTSYEERCKTNYDSPDAFDIDILINCLKNLKEGKGTSVPVYDFTIHNRSDEPWHLFPAKQIVLVDGILLYAFPEIVELLDIKIFVDTPADIRILRRLLRDVNQRKRTPQSVVDQYMQTVRPMHDKYIEPNKNCADIIVPEGGYNTQACNLIVDAIRWRIK